MGFKRNIEKMDVVLDGSTPISSVSLNGTVMTFESEDDARFVFDILNQTKDEVTRLKKKINHLAGMARKMAYEAEEEAI